MQGRDPDRDEEAPGQGPPPDRERRDPEQAGDGGPAAPESPYDTRRGGHSGQGPAHEPPEDDDATEVFGAVSDDPPRPSGGTQPPRGSEHRPPVPPQRPSEQPPAQGHPQHGQSQRDGWPDRPQTGPPSDSLRLAIGDPRSQPFRAQPRDQEPPQQSPPHQGASVAGSSTSYAQGAGAHAAGYPQPAQPDDFSDLLTKPKHPRRGLMIASIVAVAALVVGGGAFAYTSFVRGGENPGGAPVASSSTHGGGTSGGQSKEPSTPPPSPTFDPARISSAAKDTKPLRLSEEFPDKKVTIGARTFHRVATDVTKKCGQTARKGFAKTLRNADCRRVLRATFVDKKEKYAVTAGVAVLPAQAKAGRVDNAADASKNVWFAALPGPTDSGSAKIHRSGGYSALEVVGRYTVFAFAAYADKVSPPPNAEDLSKVCAQVRDYATEPIVARGMVTPSPAAR